MKLNFRKCGAEDLQTLRELSRSTYDITFRHLNTPETMKAYLDQAFDPDKLRSELSNPASEFYFLYAEGALAGYIKLNEGPAQTDLGDPEALELERIYLAKAYQGRGLGGALMSKAIETARSRNKKYLWLGVWEKNLKAIGFYEKNGFYVTGRHVFMMGDEKQSDYVMRKDL